MKKTQKLFFYFVLALALAFSVTACAKNAPSLDSIEKNGLSIKIYKSQNCGCCVGYTSYMEAKNYKVDVEVVSDVDSIKDRYNVPIEVRSCHTSIIKSGSKEYFVEGHVPEEAIVKLLTEKPDIDGIALPRMPSGSPGMPGTKDGKWVVYSVKDGEKSEFMTI